MSPVIRRMSVVLPAPSGPTSPVISPPRMVAVMPSSAGCAPPNVLTTFSSRMASGSGAGLPVFVDAGHVGGNATGRTAQMRLSCFEALGVGDGVGDSNTFVGWPRSRVREVGFDRPYRGLGRTRPALQDDHRVADVVRPDRVLPLFDAEVAVADGLPGLGPEQVDGPLLGLGHLDVAQLGERDDRPYEVHACLAVVGGRHCGHGLRRRVRGLKVVDEPADVEGGREPDVVTPEVVGPVVGGLPVRHDALVQDPLQEQADGERRRIEV